MELACCTALQRPMGRRGDNIEMDLRQNGGSVAGLIWLHVDMNRRLWW